MKTNMYMLLPENIPTLEEKTGYTEAQLRNLLHNNREFEQDCIVVVVRNAEMDRFKDMAQRFKSFSGHSGDSFRDGIVVGMRKAGQELESLIKEIEKS